MKQYHLQLSFIFLPLDKLEMKIVYSKPMRRFIHIIKAAVSVVLDGRQQEHDEAYIVQAIPEKDCIQITASTHQGVFYAFQTLRSIVFASEARANVGIPVMVPGFTIRDAPRFSYRGLHIGIFCLYHSPINYSLLIAYWHQTFENDLFCRPV